MSVLNTKPCLNRRAGPDWDVYAELSMLHLIELRSDSESSYDTYDLPSDVRELHTLLALDGKHPCEPPDPNAAVQPFVKIGSGRRSDVFAQPAGRAAVKLCKTQNHMELWNEYVQHAKLAKQFGMYDAGGGVVGVPAAHYFVPPATLGFFAFRPGLGQAAEATCPLPTSAFVMERVPPLPPRACALLMERYCSPLALPEARLRWGENAAFVVRALLGSSSEGRRRHWRGPLLRECAALRLNDMMSLHLDVRALARGMGAAMAVMHWAAGTDARGVEFVLGSSRRTVSRAPEPRMLDRLPPMSNTGPESTYHEHFFHEVETAKLWVLDFDRVRPIGLDEAGVAQAVEAAVENAAYLPRPLREVGDDKDVWAAFAVSYVEAARVILEGAAEEVWRLPIRFIQGLVEKERERKEKEEKEEGTQVVVEGAEETDDEEERWEREWVKDRRETREREAARELVEERERQEWLEREKWWEREEWREVRLLFGIEESNSDDEGESGGGSGPVLSPWETIEEAEYKSPGEGGIKG